MGILQAEADKDALEAFRDGLLNLELIFTQRRGLVRENVAEWGWPPAGALPGLCFRRGGAKTD